VYISELVGEQQRNTAIATMFSGLTIAHIVGVPIGTLIGQQFGWRGSFWFVAIFGVLALISLIFFAPKSKQIINVNYKAEFSALIRKPVVIGLLTTVFGFAGVFMIFTYISPMLVQVIGLEEKHLGLILILFGIGSTIGNLLGGKLADKNLNKTLIGTLISLIVCQILFCTIMGYKTFAIAMVTVLGVTSLLVCSPFQAVILKSAKNAPNLSSSMNVAAFNVGNALGAIAGGKIINLGLSLNFVPLIAALITSIGLVLAVYNIKYSQNV
jgi:DHA1 family inner membrane transport protein